MPDWNNVQIVQSPGVFTDTPSLDAFLLTKLDSDQSYINGFRDFFACPAFNGSSQRFHNTYYQGLLAFFSQQPQGPCPTPTPNIVICQQSCFLARDALQAIFSDVNVCSGQDVANNRQQTIQSYNDFCQRLPTDNCLQAIKSELSQCGFPLLQDARVYCDPALPGVGIQRQDPCCTIVNNPGAPVDPNASIFGDGNQGMGGLPISIIIAAAVGTVAALGIAGVVAFFLIRRRRQNAQPYSTSTTSNKVPRGFAFTGERRPSEQPLVSSPGSTGGRRRESYIPYPTSMVETNTNTAGTSFGFVREVSSSVADVPQRSSPTTTGDDPFTDTQLQQNTMYNSTITTTTLDPKADTLKNDSFFGGTSSLADYSNGGGLSEALSVIDGRMSTFTADPTTRESTYTAASSEPPNRESTYTDAARYSNMTGVSQVDPKGLFKMKVVYEYDASLPDELALAPGEIVTVTALFDDGWGHGILNGKRGAFPLACVAPLDGDAMPSTESRASYSSRRSSMRDSIIMKAEIVSITQLEPGSTMMPDFAAASIQRSAGVFSDVATLDTYLKQNLEPEQGYVNQFKQFYACPTWDGRGQRFHMTYFQAAMFHFSSAPIGKCAPPAQQVCQASCMAAHDALQAIFANPAACTAGQATQARTALLQQYMSVCSTLPTANCITAVQAEIMHCGFPLLADGQAHCARAPTDPCCQRLMGGTTPSPSSLGSAPAPSSSSRAPAPASSSAAPRPSASSTASAPLPGPSGAGGPRNEGNAEAAGKASAEQKAGGEHSKPAGEGGAAEGGAEGRTEAGEQKAPGEEKEEVNRVDKAGLAPQTTGVIFATVGGLVFLGVVNSVVFLFYKNRKNAAKGSEA
ncbi:hypothetical protein HDV05_000344 [Chytridiales sp. JEL 0842]|nr:hypothetical protein HDV05_000344 [Chytridiales sp. JEL 0842]